MATPDAVDLDMLIARIRARAAAAAGTVDHPGLVPPFSERFRGVDSAIRRDLDTALEQDVSFSSSAAGSMLWLRRPAKAMLRRFWAKQSTHNVSLLSATIGMNDKVAALAGEIEMLERRLSALESHLAQADGERDDTA